MLKYNVILFFCLQFATSSSYAQDTIPSELEQKFENLAENFENEEEDYTSLLENLEFFRQNQINLNNTSASELRELGLLDDIQINNLLAHIEKNGKLLSIYELQTIDGFALQTISSLLPYVIVTDHTQTNNISLKKVLKEGSHEITFRSQQVLESQKGFTPIDSLSLNNSPNARYLGSPLKIYTRYRFLYRNTLSIGVTAEKDAGEEFLYKKKKHSNYLYDSLLNEKPKNGFDFYSAHLFVKNIRAIKALAIGDYGLSFGQGLTLWSGLAYGKTTDAIAIKKNANGIRPYNSVDENRFMRGTALTTGNKFIQATAFFSKKKIDGNIIETDSVNYNEQFGISSLQQSGIHSTPSEILNKDAVTQTNAGGNVTLSKRNYSIGLTGMHTILTPELKRSLSTYNQFEFNGKQLSNAGLDYSILLRNFNFFGEIAISSSLQQNGIAYVNGFIASVDPRLSFSLLHRNYNQNYQSLISNAFSENTKSANESGIYLGITTKATNTITLNAYADQYKFPWLKYQAGAPSTGNDFLIQINYTPSKKLETYGRIRSRNKFSDANQVNGIDILAPTRQTNYRWNISYFVSSCLKFGNRIELVEFTKDNSKENGFLLYQDIQYKKMGSKLSLNMRYALFDTKNYNTRIYAYESDIPGTYSIPSYYYKGSRFFVTINYDITRKIEIWLRWSQTYYANKNTISEGTLNEINGPEKNEIKVQIRMKL